MKSRTTTRGAGTALLRACVRAGVTGVAIMALGAPAVAFAQTGEATQPVVRASEVGHSSRAWIDLQSSNRQAAPALPTLGAEAGLAYRRYLESFKSKIPDLYSSTLGGSGNSGGGAMGFSGSGGSN
jgi:hypothetical protein